MKFVSNLSKETLICSELQVKDYKELLKASYGEDINKLIFVETLCEIFAKTTNKPTEYFKKLNIIDLFYLLLDVRINSQGDICKVVITKDEKKMNLELRLDLIKGDLELIFQDLSAVISHNNLEIAFECPSAERLLQPTSEQYFYFIKGVYINKDNVRHFVEFPTNEHARLFLDKVTPKVAMQVVKQFEQFVGTISSVNFLSHYGIEDQTLTFLPSIDSLIWFAKLMFSETLESFYDNLFYLSQLGHMNADYVERLVVGEYNYFVNCLKRTLASKESSETQSADQLNHDDDVGLSDEPV